jgi:hypothetical protein
MIDMLAQNGLLIESHFSGLPLKRYCLEKSMFAKQINSIVLFIQFQVDLIIFSVIQRTQIGYLYKKKRIM